MTKSTMAFMDSPRVFKAGKTKNIKENAIDLELGRVRTSTMLLHLVKRHKFGLVSAWAVLITLTYLFPPLWDIVGSLVS